MKLYKRTNNSLLSWEITLNPDNSVSIIHGQEEGSKQQEAYTFPSREEAETEVNRRIHVKTTKQGYTEQIPEDVPDRPMLVHNNFEPRLLPNQVMVQPKLDGIRCLASNKGLRTRRNEPINSMPHIAEACKFLPDDVELDGELYCHGLSFQEHCSLIKRDSCVKGGHVIKLNVFDYIVYPRTYEERYEEYRNIVTFLNSSVIEPVLAVTIDLATVNDYAKAHFSSYEGAIIRDPASYYLHNTRSQHVQKLKWTMTDECQIVDIIAATSGREESAAIFICELNGITFKARPKLPLYTRVHLFQQKQHFIGFWTRITYEKLSSEGKPLKPRAEGYVKRKEDLQ